MNVPAAPHLCQHLVFSVRAEEFRMLLPALLFTSNMMQLCHLSLTVPSNALIVEIHDKHCHAVTGPIQLDQDLSSTSSKQLTGSLKLNLSQCRGISSFEAVTQEISQDSIQYHNSHFKLNLDTCLT